MKRFGNLYKKIYDMDNLKLAHQNAKKGKGWYKEVMDIDSDPDKYLGQLQDMLKNHTYQTSEYQMFIKRDSGKDRKIFKLPYFPDRIAQWAIIQVIEPFLIRNFTDDTYSAIPNKGIHYGLKRVTRDIQTDVKGCQYCLKIDAKHYYQSINHDILKQKYRRMFKDPELLWLLDEIIDSIDTAEIDDLRNIYLMEEDVDEETGIPIGNYLSQYSGNYYFSSFDHWVKEELHVKHYHRYMDDIVIFAETKEELHEIKKKIDKYFKEELKLSVKANWQVFPTFVRGVDYLGYRIFLNYILLRKSTYKQMKQKMNRILKKVITGKMMNHSEWCSINSYHGWLIHCNSFRLSKKYISPLEKYADNYYQHVIKKGKSG